MIVFWRRLRHDGPPCTPGQIQARVKALTDSARTARLEVRRVRAGTEDSALGQHVYRRGSAVVAFPQGTFLEWRDDAR